MQRQEHADGRLLSVQNALEVADHGNADATALDAHNSPFRGPCARAEVDEAVDPAVRALLLAAIGLGIDERAGSPLELILVPFRQVLRARQVLRRPVHLEGEAGKGVLHPLLNE